MLLLSIFTMTRIQAVYDNYLLTTTAFSTLLSDQPAGLLNPYLGNGSPRNVQFVVGLEF
jgi:hypothetical protein